MGLCFPEWKWFPSRRSGCMWKLGGFSAWFTGLCFLLWGTEVKGWSHRWFLLCLALCQICIQICLARQTSMPLRKWLKLENEEVQGWRRVTSTVYLRNVDSRCVCSCEAICCFFFLWIMFPFWPERDSHLVCLSISGWTWVAMASWRCQSILIFFASCRWFQILMRICVFNPWICSGKDFS